MCRRALWPSFIVFLTATGAAAGEGPAAAPAAQISVDAWGQTFDTTERLRGELAGIVAGEMEMPGWEKVAFRILEMEGQILPRLAAATELDLHCGKGYRREHPDSTREQYLAFLETAEGQTYETACLAEQLTGKEIDSTQVDSVAASFEIAIVLPTLLQAVRSRRADMLLPDVPELPPETEESFSIVVKDAFGKSRCLVREALAKVPLSKVLKDPESFQDPFHEAVTSGLCDNPSIWIRRPQP